MCTFDNGGTTYRVEFKYTPTPESDTCRMISECFIINPNDKSVIATGRAYCSFKDNPNHKVGRKLAMSRALISMFPGGKDTQNKLIRFEIWLQLLNTPVFSLNL